LIKKQKKKKGGVVLLVFFGRVVYKRGFVLDD